MSLIRRIQNGTTTERDAEAVKNLMSSKVDKSYELMRRSLYTKIMIVLFALGALLVGLSLGGLFF